MSLPNLKSFKPTYTVYLPISDKEVKFSPYTTEQEQAILIASQDNDYKNVIVTLETLMSECCDFVPDTIVDFSILATNMNAKSQGEGHTFVLKKCSNDDCNNTDIKITVDNILDHIEIKNKENIKATYDVADNFSIRLYPTRLDMLKNISNENSIENSKKQIYSMIAHSIEYVFHEGNIIRDFTTDELIEKVISQLTPNQIKEINAEIGKLVSVSSNIKYVCQKCEKEFTKEVQDFLF